MIAGTAMSRWGIGYPECVELPANVKLLRPRVVASSTQMWSHVEGTLTVRERDGTATRTYSGAFTMRRR